MKRAMVVLSGGQDSTTCLFWARQHFDEVHAVTFDYGQRHKVEIESAVRIAALAKVRSHQVVNVSGVLQSRSPLVDTRAELETYTDFSSMDRIIGDRVELTFVPMRNAVFLTIAANIALAQNCFDLVTGVCQSDNANYPDCRQSFIDAQEALINTALGISGFVIHAPLMNLDKAAIVQLARSIDGAWDGLAWSHTCYAGAVPPCGECHACVLRAHGFAQANEVDPLITRTAHESR